MIFFDFLKFLIFFDFLKFLIFMIYIQDVGIPAKGLRPKLCCFVKKSLKDSNVDFSPVGLSVGLAAVALWRRTFWKIVMEVILVLGFKYLGFVLIIML